MLKGGKMGYVRHLAACVVALSLPACITVTGQSPAQIKSELQQTFLYRSATAFDTGAGTGPFNANERLNDQQKRYIVGEYQKMADAILATYAKHRQTLVQSFGALPAGPKMRPKVS